MKSLVSFAKRKISGKLSSGGVAFFFPYVFFSLSSPTNAKGCVVGTCAETVVKRTVRQEGKYCPCRGSEDCWARGWCASGGCVWSGSLCISVVSSGALAKSRREVVSSSFVVVCNACGIFFFFLLLFLQYCLFSHCCCSPKIFLFWCRGWCTHSASRGPCTARFIITLLGQNKCICQRQQLQTQLSL